MLPRPPSQHWTGRSARPRRRGGALRALSNRTHFQRSGSAVFYSRFLLIAMLTGARSEGCFPGLSQFKCSPKHTTATPCGLPDECLLPVVNATHVRRIPPHSGVGMPVCPRSLPARLAPLDSVRSQGGSTGGVMRLKPPASARRRCGDAEWSLISSKKCGPHSSSLRRLSSPVVRPRPDKRLSARCRFESRLSGQIRREGGAGRFPGGDSGSCDRRRHSWRNVGQAAISAMNPRRIPAV